MLFHKICFEINVNRITLFLVHLGKVSKIRNKLIGRYTTYVNGIISCKMRLWLKSSNTPTQINSGVKQGMC